jgi:hypothetical protein
LSAIIRLGLKWLLANSDKHTGKTTTRKYLLKQTKKMFSFSFFYFKKIKTALIIVKLLLKHLPEFVFLLRKQLKFHFTPAVVEFGAKNG